jgi:hypothetical protein
MKTKITGMAHIRDTRPGFIPDAAKPKSEAKASIEPTISKAKAFENFTIEFVYQGTQYRVDLKDVVKGTPLGDPKFFIKMKLEAGFPTWPNRIDFLPSELLEIAEPIKVSASLR